MSDKNEKSFADKMQEGSENERVVEKMKQELSNAGATQGEIADVVRGFGAPSHAPVITPSIEKTITGKLDDIAGRDVLTYDIIQDNIVRYDNELKKMTPEARVMTMEDLSPDAVLSIAGFSEEQIKRVKEYAPSEYAEIAKQVNANPASLSGISDYDMATGIFNLSEKLSGLEKRIEEDALNREALEGPAHDAGVSLPSNKLISSADAKEFENKIEENLYAGNDLQEPSLNEDDPFTI